MSSPKHSHEETQRCLPSLSEPLTSTLHGGDPERTTHDISLQLHRVPGMTSTVAIQPLSDSCSTITQRESAQLGTNRESSFLAKLDPTLKEECNHKSSSKNGSLNDKTVNHATVKNAEQQKTLPQAINPTKVLGVDHQRIQVPERKHSSKISAIPTSKSWISFKQDRYLTSSFSKSKRLADNGKLPSLGPLNITNLDEFLEISKREFEISYKEKITYDDYKSSHFKTIKTLGKGSFGKVVLAQLKDDDTLCAIKVLNKQEIIRKKQVLYVMSEKRILQALNFPFTINLRVFLADTHHLYFVMPYVSGGDFSHFLSKHNPLKEPHAQFYVGQLVLALEYLHYLGLIHRDIKPVNIVIDGLGYLKVVDFGQCVRVLPKDKTWTMTGTPEYMAPEIIMGKGYDSAVDWWSLGVVTFEMCAGFLPFKGETVDKMGKLIMKGKYHYPGHFSNKLKAFISKLLESSPTRRIAKDPRERGSIIKSLLWLKDTDWLALLNRTIPPPNVPLALKGHAQDHVNTNKELHKA